MAKKKTTTKKRSTTKPLTQAEIDFPPGRPVDVQYFRDGRTYWVKGYEVFNPERLVSCAAGRKGGGAVPLELKADRFHGIWICKPDYRGRPLLLDQNRVRVHQPSDALEFGQVFS